MLVRREGGMIPWPPSRWSFDGFGGGGSAAGGAASPIETDTGEKTAPPAIAGQVQLYAARAPPPAARPLTPPVPPSSSWISAFVGVTAGGKVPASTVVACLRTHALTLERSRHPSRTQACLRVLHILASPNYLPQPTEGACEDERTLTCPC